MFVLQKLTYFPPESPFTKVAALNKLVFSCLADLDDLARSNLNYVFNDVLSPDAVPERTSASLCLLRELFMLCISNSQLKHWSINQFVRQGLTDRATALMVSVFTCFLSQSFTCIFYFFVASYCLKLIFFFRVLSFFYDA